MEILLFFIALTIFASICHGLWVIGSLIYRFFSSGGSFPQKKSVSTENENEQHRLVTQRFLRRLYYEGKIPEQELQKLLKYTEKDFKKPSSQPSPKATKPINQAGPTTPSAEPAPSPPAKLEESDVLEVEDFLDEDDFLEEPTVKKRPATPDTIRPAKHPLPQTEPVEKRAFGSILNAFMEEKNIRWGELISGLLIVGSAIGLVVSLWSTLRNQIPYLPALLFLLATAAIHSAGLYTFKRWKLESTSRGLLLITVLLVPLNFLAAIRLSDHRPVSDPLFIFAISIGFAAFGWMVLSASRILISFGRWQLLIAVLGSSAGQIIISRMSISEPVLLRTTLLAALPVGCFIVAIASILKHTFIWKEISDALARELVTLGGLSLFAVLAPCWLLVWNSTSRLETFACLTPLVSIMELLLLGMGLVLHHRKENDDAPHWSLAGSSIAVFSALMMLMNFAIAWPRVDIMIVLGIVNGISLTLLAINGRFAVCHIPALISASLAGLLGFHVLTDTIALQGTSQRMLIEALLLGRSAIVLISFAILTSLAGVWLKRTSKSEAGKYYLYAAGCFSIGSSLIAVYGGYFTRTDDIWCTLALLINAITFLFANWQVRKQVLSGFASALWFLALQHALCIDTPFRNWLSERALLPDAPFVWGCLIHATSGLLFLIGLHFWSRSGTQLTQPWSLRPSKGNPFTTPLIFGSIITSSLLVPYVILQTMSAEMHAFYAFWIMLIWLTVALIQRSDLWFLFTQCAGTVGTLYTATAVGEYYGLWADAGRGTPRYWLFHIMAISLWVLMGSAIHSKKYSRNMLGALSRTSRWNLQPVLLAGSIVSTGVVLFLSITPSIATDFELAFNIQKIHQYAAPLMLGLFLYTLCVTIVALTKPRESGIGTQVGLILSLFLLIAAFSLQNLHISLATIGFPVRHAKDAFGIWSWLCLGLLSVACLPYLNSKFQKQTTQGLLFVTYLIPFLIAGYFIEQHHTADALRWGLGVYALIMMLLILKSESLMDYLRAQQIRLRYLPKLFEDKTTWRNLSMLGACLPLLVLTLYQVFGTWLKISVPLEDGATSSLIMLLLTFCVPLLMLVIASVFHAIHFRSAGWMLIGSHVLAVISITVTILSFSEPPAEFRIDDLLQISLYTGLALSVYGLFWLGIESKIDWNFQEHQNLSPVTWPLIRVHLVTLLCLVVGPYFLPLIMNLIHPEHNWVTYFPQIPFISLISLVLAATCVHVFARRYFSSLPTNGLSCLSLALIGFFTVSGWQYSEWTAWQINLFMEIGLVLVGLFHTIRFVMRSHPPKTSLEDQTTAFRHLNWTQLICLTLFAFAFRGAWSDAYRPYPALMIATTGTLLYFTLGLSLRKQILAYASLVTALLGTMFVFTAHWFDAGVHITSQNGMDLLKWSITTAASISGFWLLVDLYRQRSQTGSNKLAESPAFQQVLARTLTCIVLFYTLLITVSRTLPVSTDVPLIRDPAGWIALFAVTLLLMGLIWDRKSRYCIPALFTMGICLIATYLSNETELRRLIQYSGLALSGYAFLLSILWSLRNLISQNLSWLSIPNFDAFRKQTRSWLPPAVTLLAVYTMLALLHSVLRLEVQSQRWWSVLGTALTSLTFYAMSTHTDLSQKFKQRAILAGGLAGIYCGWALLPAHGNFYFLDHLIRFLEAVSILSLLTTLVLVKWPSLKQDWSEALRKSSRTFLIAAGISLLGILISETGFQIAGIPLVISKARIAVVSAALVLLSAALILMAAVPKYDPFQLTLKRRMLYVYASEIVLALLFLHIYLTMPELFRGYLLPYWPYIVIAIAFTGAGVGEFFERIGLNVLSEPLQRTGTFLPLLPALSFWIHAASRQASPVVGDYSMILLLISLVYVVMSLWRKSFVYTTLAALAGNGALWAFWAEQGQFFTQHPQLWLIPPALSVLIATHLNRDKLNTTQLTAIRYFSTISIYVSSTGDMFIAGVAENLWLPVILCGLSVLGMFAGMMFRVRAFLYVGASFLVLSIVSMIWHASQSLGHIWPWWAFGIGLGICILTLFGLFEKRKNEMQNLVNQLKTWDR